MSELAFEYLVLALESVRGTGISTPTHYAGLKGMVTPRFDVWRPDESRGTFEEYYRAVKLKNWGEWQAEGGLDVYMLPVFLEMIAKGGITASTPSGATSARLRQYVPSASTDDVKSATFWWGDPGVQIWQGAFGMLDSLTISADTGSSDGAKMSLKGTTNFPTKVSAPTLPSQLVGPLISGTSLDLYIDTTLAIGTTAVTGRLISVETTIPLNAVYKYRGSSTGNYTKIGRKKRHITTKLVLELLDVAQYDLWAAFSTLKTRVRINGDTIESTFKHYVEIDTYGPAVMDWGETDSTSRTLALTIESQTDSTLGASWRIAVENDQATL